MIRKHPIVVLVGILLVVVAGVGIWATRENTETPDQHTTETIQTTEEQPVQEQPQGFDTSAYALDEPGSPWWVVNKQRPLPGGYVPPDLVVPNVRLRLGPGAEQMQFSSSVVPALEEMFAAAATDGVTLVFGSGYRSEAYQRTLYNGYVASNGQAYADRVSARPGTSEHQTGLAFDVTAANGACHLEKCFANTPEGRWVAENAYKYGFIIRYPDGKESITGYDYEPWHLRYVGTELAAEMHKTGVQTLEEFFNLPPAPNY